MRWIRVKDELPPIHEDVNDERGYVLILMVCKDWPGGGYRTFKASRVVLEDGWYWSDEQGDLIEDEDNLIRAWAPIEVDELLLKDE
jgi:hypothetical protein